LRIRGEAKSIGEKEEIEAELIRTHLRPDEKRLAINV
jgi:hypothetical protein